MSVYVSVCVHAQVCECGYSCVCVSMAGPLCARVCVCLTVSVCASLNLCVHGYVSECCVWFMCVCLCETLHAPVPVYFGLSSYRSQPWDSRIIVIHCLGGDSRQHPEGTL